MSTLTKAAILVIALGLAAAITGPKLYRMAQIKGFVDGAQTEIVTVTNKWHQSVQGRRAREVYWVTWTNQDIKQVGSHRLNLTAERWNSVEIGDKIELIRLPGRDKAYDSAGIFVSEGNFIFDLLLLLLEIGVTIGMAISIYLDVFY